MGQAEPTEENYAERVRQLYEEDADRILELYPGRNQQKVLQSATGLGR